MMKVNMESLMHLQLTETTEWKNPSSISAIGDNLSSFHISILSIFLLA